MVLGCDGWCPSALFPWLLMAGQAAAIVTLAWLADRGWMHRPTARAAIWSVAALLVGSAYVGNFSSARTDAEQEFVNKLLQIVNKPRPARIVND